MTTQYKYRVTIVVPQRLIVVANHLACIVGESAADINTFTSCGWQDSSGNLYAVASTVVKPVFLEAVSGLPETPQHAIDVADSQLAQQALDLLKVYESGVMATPGHIVLAIDCEPLEALTFMGISIREEGDVQL